MKRSIRISLVLALGLVLLLGVAFGASAALQTYDSGIQVQNLEATDANITITFYNADGSTAATVNDTVPGGGSNTYFPLENMGSPPASVPSGFDGSVVIASDKQVAAIANVLGSDGTDPLAFGASYSGFSAGSTSSFLPLLMNDNFGFTTWFSVQNTSSGSVDITVNYSDGTSATALSVAPGAAAKFEQDMESHAAGWVGSGVVTATGGEIAATVMEVGPTTLFAYDGFTGGSTNPVMPLFQANNFGFVTGLRIQNTDASNASDVTVTYTPGPSQPGTACTETRTIQPNTAASFGLYVFTTFADPDPGSLVSENCNVEQFVGSASVTANSANVDLTVIVNQLNNSTNKGAAYNGFDPSVASERTVFPLIMDRNFGYFTGWNIFNTGAALNAGDVVCTVTGTDNSGAVNMTFNSPAIGSGEGWNQVNLNTIGDGFVGSASCAGPTGSLLVGSVNEVNTALSGDAFLVYEGFNTGP